MASHIRLLHTLLQRLQTLEPQDMLLMQPCTSNPVSVKILRLSAAENLVTVYLKEMNV